ncbi:MAG: DJ-1/PfpI family protein [Bacteroidota bacterium]
MTNGGFKFDVATPTGKPAILEDWSVPQKEEAVLAFMSKNKSKFDESRSLKRMVEHSELKEDSDYMAVFLPGGHGSMLGLPEDENVGTLIRWTKASDRHLIAVCHGPAALLATAKNNDEPHPYDGYKMVAFPDSGDKQSPVIGYLPGQLPWLQCEELEKQGIEIINDKITGATHIDRKLISGDSPKACDDLGRIAVKALFKEVLL